MCDKSAAKSSSIPEGGEEEINVKEASLGTGRAAARGSARASSGQPVGYLGWALKEGSQK